MRSLQRRNILQLLGVSIGGATAGCLGYRRGGPPELPENMEWQKVLGPTGFTDVSVAPGSGAYFVGENRGVPVGGIGFFGLIQRVIENGNSCLGVRKTVGI